MPVSVPDQFVDGLIESLNLDPATLDANARQRFTHLLNNEVEIAARDHHRDIMRTARAEAVDCLHGPDRPGGLDGRFAGPLALVRALTAEVYRLRDERRTTLDASVEALGRAATSLEERKDDEGVHIWWGAAGHIRKHIDFLADPSSGIPAEETKAEKIARYSEALDFVLSPEWLPWFEHHRPDLMASLRAATQKMLDGAHDRPSAPRQIHPADAPVPPHHHLDDHDPRDWTPECCACQHQSGDRDFVDETCAACCAIRDGYRAYTRREFAVRHPSGVVEDRVPEGMARRGVTKHPEQTLLVRERIVTPDVVGPYVEMPVEPSS